MISIHDLYKCPFSALFYAAAYYLPAWVPASEYANLAQELGLDDIRTDDWSEFVLPFWPAVIRSALIPGNFIRMFRSGMITVKGAIASVRYLTHIYIYNFGFFHC